jgi:UDP-glucose 4-epimerase
MKILVTGGAGFIGSHLSEALINLGHNVTILDNLETSNISNLRQSELSENFKFIQGSILDYKLLHELVDDSEYVFHLAAAVGVLRILENPLASLLTNIRGTENILEICDKLGVPILIASSSEVYGKNTSSSLREDSDRILGSSMKLRWSYSQAKAIDEVLAYSYFVERDLQTRIVRFFNTVGPRQLGNYGMVLPRFVGSAIAGNPLTIYGTGEQTRCFTHVLDVVDALVAVAFAQKTVGRTLNIGNTFEISILDLAKKVILDLGSDSEIIFETYDSAYGDTFEDMDRRVPNIDLIKELVGWSPKRSLTEIILDISAEMKKKL